MTNPTPPKPGLYDHHITPAERQALEATPCNDLSGEIDLLRVCLARFLDAQPDFSAPGTFLDRVTFLNTISLAVGHIASLTNIQMNGMSPLSEIESEIEEGLKLARLSLGLLESGDPLEGFASSAEEDKDQESE